MHVDLFSIGRLTVHTYGVMIAIGIILCVILANARAKRRELSPEPVLDIAILCVVTGFLGAKLFYVLNNLSEFLDAPLSVLGSSGFVVYGGIIIGVAAAFLYCRAKKLKFFAYFDLIAPSVALAQACGRIGCFFAGCCYGKETDLPIGIVFPEGSFAPAGVPLFPTQLISSAGDFLIMLVLILFARGAKREGDVGALYLLLYGIGRFSIEFFRTNTQGGIGIFTTAQCLSLVFVLIAILLFIRNRIVYNRMDREYLYF